MAANLQRRGFASVGKQFIERSRIGGFRDQAPVSAFRRGAHVSVYDKNPDDEVRPTVVPDDVIEPVSDKYWAPHPQTGVFGPGEHHNLAGEEQRTPPADGSVLEQEAWFRPLEDVDKPRPV